MAKTSLKKEAAVPIRDEIRQSVIADLAKTTLVDLVDIVGKYRLWTWSPWAILLVRFSDDKGPDPALGIYEQLFTSKGKGTLNMVDFFDEMSHGNLDLSGTKIFGWFTLPAKKADYVGNTYPQPAGKLNRNGLVDLAKATAAAAGVKLSDYAGVVVSCFGQVDLCGWVGGMTALCDTLSLTPSLLGQEMGHGYGLDHARLLGSTDDYTDPWDVMSTAAFPAMQAPHAQFTTVGPGLNAHNMRSRGWLDETRVWSASGADDAVVQLRPLHRRHLSGFLAAQMGPYLVEFRLPERWDAAIPRGCVLVHRFQDNHSYLVPANGGGQSLTKGDVFSTGDPSVVLTDFYSVQVVNIDAGGRTATLRMRQRARKILDIPSLVGEIFGGIAVDGGGFILIGGKIHRVPPRGPILALLEQLSQYMSVSTSRTGVDTARAAQRAALVGIVQEAIALHAQTEVVSHHPPGYQGHE